MTKLTVHCVVKNEEKWIWFAIESIRDIAKRYGVTDTAILLRLNRYKKANILPKSILKATKGKVERLELKD